VANINGRAVNPSRDFVEMLIYPLPPQESAAGLFCNYSFFKGKVHHPVYREKQQKPTREQTG